MSPSIAAMVLFIAVPIISIALQSLHSEPDKVVEVIETCGPFGCTETTLVTDSAEDAGGFSASFPDYHITPTATISRYPRCQSFGRMPKAFGSSSRGC